MRRVAYRDKIRDGPQGVNWRLRLTARCSNLPLSVISMDATYEIMSWVLALPNINAQVNKVTAFAGLTLYA